MTGRNRNLPKPAISIKVHYALELMDIYSRLSPGVYKSLEIKGRL